MCPQYFEVVDSLRQVGVEVSGVAYVTIHDTLRQHFHVGK
jgi:hypothetical protein